MSRHGLVVATIALAVAGSPSPDPLRPPDFVVAGIRDGIDSASVRHILGAPDSSSIDDDVRAPGTKLISQHYRDLVILLGSNNSVGGILITGPGRRTVRGLRVGDSAARVRRPYGPPPDEPGGVWQYDEPRGGRVLLITFVKQHVERIYLGYTYD